MSAARWDGEARPDGMVATAPFRMVTMVPLRMVANWPNDARWATRATSVTALYDEDADRPRSCAEALCARTEKAMLCAQSLTRTASEGSGRRIAACEHVGKE
eukprot:196036-Prymnesium_polylepis.1